ncbi:MAG TPA: NAD(P)H-hydrate dehydratase [Dehalococcoidia bacterium]|nr:NAD(P)H-hydrate dehydratase [Dehalococcoidia bacterium]
MKLVTVEQMRALEQAAAEAGRPPSVLMEEAGLAVAQETWMALGLVADRSVLALIGPGNNGGDGLVAARHLADFGAKVGVYLLRSRGEDDPNYRQVIERNIPVGQVEDDPDLAGLREALAGADAVIDALLGTGRARPIEGPLAAILDALRERQALPNPPLVVAVDLPTGVDADTGAADPRAVRADLTVTMGFAKVGLYCLPGAELAGRVQVVDIGIPAEAARDLPYELLDTTWVKERLPERPRGANKGTFGRILVCGGSERYIGAPRLCAAAAYRVGGGLVTVACPRSIASAVGAGLDEATYLPLPETAGLLAEDASAELRREAAAYDVIAVGPGLGRGAGPSRFVRETLLAPLSGGPRAAVIDADALNALAEEPRWWERLALPSVLTPHPGELSRLTRRPIAAIQSDRLGAALECARQWGQVVVLKGAYTVVASPDGRAVVSPFANPALASAGTGDVLAGTIAGLLGQGMAPFDAAACGVYLHAKAAEEVCDDIGDRGLLASDLLGALPRAIRVVREGVIRTKGAPRFDPLEMFLRR